MSRRSRRRGGRPWRRYLLAALLISVALALASGGPIASFTSAELSREGDLAIASDENGVVSLSLADDLHTGATQDLATVGNYLGVDVRLTVALVDGSGGGADLVVDGTNEGDEFTTDLAYEAAQNVSVKIPCGSGLAGGSLSVRFRAEGPDLDARLTRSVPVRTGDCTSARLVYVAPSDGQLHSVTTGSSPRAYDATGVGVIGPQTADLDGDGDLEIPFVNGAGTLAVIDASNETTRLTADARDSKSLVWAGAWNGSATAVYFANETNDRIYRVRPGGTPVEVSADAATKAIAGAADIDGDGNEELVYLGTSAGLRYLTGEGGTEKVGVSVGSNYGYGVGEPADFDGDGVARIPIVTGSNNVVLVAADGTKTKLGGSAEKTALASFDWDGDGALEVVYLDKSTHQLMVVDDIDGDGTVEITTATDGSGDPVTADRGPGAA